jgi:uncharacterized protein
MQTKRKRAQISHSLLHDFEFLNKQLIFDGNSLDLFDVTQFASGENQISAIDMRRLLQKHSRLSASQTVFESPRERQIRSMWLNVAHYCNLSCSYCFAQHGQYGMKETFMEISTARSAIELLFSQCGSEDRIQLVFFGGEPLSNWNTLTDSIEYCEQLSQQKGIKARFILITNGTLLTASRIEYLKLHSVTIQISLDGPAEVNDQLRKFRNGRGSSSAVHRNIKKLHEANFSRLAVRSTLTHLNCDLTVQIDHFIHSGFRSIAIIPVQPHDETDDLKLTKSDARSICKEYGRRAQVIAEQVISGNKVDLECFSHYVPKLLDRQKKNYFCGAGFQALTVTPTGDLYVCHRLVGNLEFRAGTITEGLSFDQPSAATLGILSVDDKSMCSKCWAKYVCGGGCDAASFSKEKCFGVPDKIFCEITKSVIEGALGIVFAFIQKRHALSISPPPKTPEFQPDIKVSCNSLLSHTQVPNEIPS